MMALFILNEISYVFVVAVVVVRHLIVTIRMLKVLNACFVTQLTQISVEYVLSIYR